MPDPVITNVNVSSLLVKDIQYSEELLTLGGADTIAPGTILARDSVSKKLVLFAKGGNTNENGIPKAVLPYQVVVTGSGDVKVQAVVGGVLVRGKLIIDADGDGSNVDAPVLDQLRDYGINTIVETELGKLDNQ